MTERKDTQRALNAADRDVMRQEPATVLPDGSAFFTGSFPLPKDHWLYAPICSEWDGARDTPSDTPRPILTHEIRDRVVDAVRYAVRGATMCGAEKDFDPDALVQNAVYALCGPYGDCTSAASPTPPAEQQGEQEPVATVIKRVRRGVSESHTGVEIHAGKQLPPGTLLYTRPSPSIVTLRAKALDTCTRLFHNDEAWVRLKDVLAEIDKLGGGV